MDPIGTAALSLGAQVVKGACKLWLGDGFAGSMADTVTDLLQDQVPDAIQRQKLKGMFDGFAVTVAEKARRIDEQRFRSVPDHERESAILAVAETFSKAELGDPVLLSLDFNARALEKHLEAYIKIRKSAWGLSERAEGLFGFLLRECCSYLLEIKKSLPPYTREALTELLGRTTAIERQLDEVLTRLPDRTSMTGYSGFETDYRRQLITELDRASLFGASAFAHVQGYQLSVAYISLLVADFDAVTGRYREVAVETVLTDSRRVFIRGEAGSGKTTLLQWLAVTAARGAFTGALEPWNELVPFFLRLREFAELETLPPPEDFLRAGVARSLAALMPVGWVHQILRAGRGIILIDGVDEVPKLRREMILEWLRNLESAFPKARFIVTSRPAAATEGWLWPQGFSSCFVQPMSLSDIRKFIDHWRDAVTLTLVDQAAKDALAQQSATLIDRIFTKRHLRQLATNPLMCALLCALNRDRYSDLPESRIELFRIALEMFLQRRDHERWKGRSQLLLEYPDKVGLLQSLAYWMMTNDLAAAERGRVIEHLDSSLAARRHRIVGSAADVLDHLLERSGVIREPVAGSIDFIHRSFQEFLAAQAVVDRDDIEALVRYATDDQWQQVVILAAGLGNRRQSGQLLQGLLNPPRRSRRYSTLLGLIALGCLETTTEIDPEATAQILARTDPMIPPRTVEHVDALALTGDFVLELLEGKYPADLKEFECTAMLAARIGGDSGVQIFKRLLDITPGKTDSPQLATIVRHWDFFDPILFADQILTRVTPEAATIVNPKTVAGIAQVPTLERLTCIFGRDHTDYDFIGRAPNLRHVLIQLDRLHQGIELTFGRSSTLVELTRKADSATPRRASTSGPTLHITQLDARRLLPGMRIRGHVENLTIEDDIKIVDLEGLVIPDTIKVLSINNCTTLRSLRGAAALLNSSITGIIVSRPGPQFSVEDLPHEVRTAERKLALELGRFEIHLDERNYAQLGEDAVRELTEMGFPVTRHAYPAQFSFVATRRKALPAE